MDSIFFITSLIAISGGTGGLVFALATPNSHNLTIPLKGEEIDTGFIGHILIGIAAAFVVVALAQFLGIDIEFVKKQSVSGELISQPAISTILRVFAIGIIGGFTGLKIIETVSNKLMKEVQERLEKIEQKSTADSKTLSCLIDDQRLLWANEKLNLGLYAEALNDCDDILLRFESGKVYGTKARALRGLGRLDEAIDAINKGIEALHGQVNHETLPILYWNRACYKALKNMDINDVISDIDKSLELNSEFSKDICKDPDLIPCRDNPVFKNHFKEHCKD